MIPIPKVWLDETERDAHRILDGHAADNVGDAGRCLGDMPATLCSSCTRAAATLCLIAAYREAIETIDALKALMPEEVIT